MYNVQVVNSQSFRTRTIIIIIRRWRGGDFQFVILNTKSPVAFHKLSIGMIERRERAMYIRLFISFFIVHTVQFMRTNLLLWIRRKTQYSMLMSMSENALEAT